MQATCGFFGCCSLKTSLIALTGGLLGVGLAYAGVKSIVALKPVGVPRLTNIHIDLRVLVFAAVVSIVTGLVFGLLPARQAARSISTTR